MSNAKVVYKYVLKNTSLPQPVVLPVGAELLLIERQIGRPCLWALVQADVTETEARAVQIVGTGVAVEGIVRYLNTVVYSSDDPGFPSGIVLHAFEVRR